MERWKRRKEGGKEENVEEEKGGGEVEERDRVKEWKDVAEEN